MKTVAVAAYALMILAAAVLGAAPSLDSLPAKEKELADTVDHWGLPFSDQLRRFQAGEAAIQKELGEKAPKNFIVGIQHGLDKVPLNKYWFKGQYTTRVQLNMARNEYESFQLAVLPRMGKELKNITVRASLDIRDNPGIADERAVETRFYNIYRVGYAETAPAQYPSLYRGPWPDALLPNGPSSASGTDLALFWIELKTEPAAPSRYAGKIIVTVDDEELSIPIDIRVFDFTLPDRVPYPVVAWTQRKLPDGKEMELEQYRMIWLELLRHGIDPASVGREYVDINKEPDFALQGKILDYCFYNWMQVFELPRVKTEELERLRPYVEYLTKRGWLDKAIIYANTDEPNEQQFNEQCVPFAAKVRELYPGVRVYLASEYHEGMDRGCDIWLNDLSTGKGIEFAVANKGKADLWAYYCHLPVRVDFHRPLVQAPNMQIDSEAVEHRVPFWLHWKYGAKGMFIWSANSEWAKEKDGLTPEAMQAGRWALNPKISKYPYAGTHNGNGYLIYPGAAPSIRMKVLRDGLEDYGYFMELEKRLKEREGDQRWQARHAGAIEAARKFMTVPESVAVDPHYFNRDPQGIFSARERLAKAIELLGE